MTRKKLKPASNNYQLLKTSWGVQGKLFFENSTLHGVRYIPEDGRPFYERFMWFVCVAISTVATTVIIYNLWEKFQTNPTITGLDTDFHNWDVPFPAITVCMESPTTVEKIHSYIFEHLERNATDQKEIEFFKHLTQLSYGSWKNFVSNYSSLLNSTDFQRVASYRIKDVVFNLANTCEEVFEQCYWKLAPYNCCDGFFPVFTENGFCYTFNSRHYEKKVPGREGELPRFNMKYIKETDKKWSMQFYFRSFDGLYPIYILNSDETAGVDVQPQHVWDTSVDMVAFSVKQTYTTKDTAQLSIKQRRCAFPDEINLKIDDTYSYSGCTRQCRMDRAMKLCGCVPFFYPEVGAYKHCSFQKMKCIGDHLKEIKAVQRCSCYLGCSNTVYEVEKFNDAETSNKSSSYKMDCQFVSWPMVRYKREVLFGWVDLLVSFGGIAGLFLGFSLLSGVEILYYFTVRACCMVVREKQELRKIQLERAAKPPPEYDLSLVPYFISKPLPGHGIDEVAKNLYVHNLLNYSKDKANKHGNVTKVRPAADVIAPFGIEFVN
ncbi:hypothetical protein NQ315_011782 [Exocentrus adspersus]|uniref:Sodium channel protein Nach n=1 Tax=Exocentrus adspersus TaxID=1586481 RepID=A0AAV8W0R0_9CUCU|nr:hypothetical protein NQ315_011782 [Exocentrus adspersus]